MMKFFKPRYMLTVYLTLCFVFSVAAMTTAGTISVAMVILVLCFESVRLSYIYLLPLPSLTEVSACVKQLCFATIFTLALRGLGRHTKRGGSMLVAAISGGCVFPPMMGAVVVSSQFRYYFIPFFFFWGMGSLKMQYPCRPRGTPIRPWLSP